MRYLPALDGLRALAVLAVLLAHTHAPGFSGGAIGVDVFFVLSGYLITRVLGENRPTLREFYLRRVRRLVPALALMLAAYVAVFPLFEPGYPHVRDASLAFFYLSDYSLAFWRIPNWLGHTWSLSVEEHFYLLWPLIFLRFRPNVKILLAAYAVTTFWHWAPEGAIHIGSYARFDTRMSGLILGCVLAQVPRSRIPAWLGLAGLAWACVANPADLPNTQRAVAMMGVELAAAVAIIGQAPTWLSHRWPVYLGKLSYGVYLWHYPIARLCTDRWWSWQGATFTTLGLSLLFAVMSYHTIEALSRRRKHLPELAEVNI